MHALLLPLLIFLAELSVVSFSTVRIICISRGQKKLAPFLGFFEILLWLFAIGQIMQNLSNPLCYVAFASGFMMGNFLGIVIEEKIALGSLLVRVITPKDPSWLIQQMRENGYGVTVVEGQGVTGQVKIIFTIIPRRSMRQATALIKKFDPRAFYSADDLRTTASGVTPRPSASPIPHPHWNLPAATVPQLGEKEQCRS